MANLTLWVDGLVANLEDRTLTGLLLPFNEVGFTNLGKVTASAESKIDIAPTVTLNRQHNGDVPLGKAVTLETTEKGIASVWKVLATRDGDDALVEANEGVRRGLSVELDPVVVKDGHLISGTLKAAGHVVTPAFPSAMLAADAPVVPDTEDPATEPPQPIVRVDGEELPNVVSVTIEDPADATSPAVVDITTKPEDNPNPETPKTEEPNMTAAATATNAALIAANAKKTDRSKLFATLASVAPSVGKNQSALEAALADVVPGDILGVEQPQYVGQLWSGTAYERRIVPLYNHADLTSFKVQGWQWVTKPEVDDYAGNKGAVPSAGIETESVDIDAYRLAGAHDIDRKFRDFSSPEFWDAYYAAMAESTKKKSDVKVRGIVRDAATRVHLLDAAMTEGVPTALNLIVKGVLNILDTLETIPDHALVTTDVYEPLLYTKESDVLAYLNAALNLKDGTLQGGGFKIIPVPTGSLTVDLATDFVGKVMVGCRDAVTVHELGGDAPIRVEAPNIANGGVDAGVFYYGATNVHSADGLVLYDAPTAS